MTGGPNEVKARNETRAMFESALQAYEQKEFATARKGFEQVLSVNPTDHVASLYIQTAIQLERDGPPPDWEGTEVDYSSG